MKIAEKIFDFLSSLRLAVIIILALGIVASVGTIYEARYDADVAQKLVYRSVYMYAVMIALIVNLIAVMIDRWPWRKHHTGFVLAHIGIITLLVGSYVTQKTGLDGTMNFGIGESNRYVTTAETELAAYATKNGEAIDSVFRREVDFLRHPPQTEPLVEDLGRDKLEVVDYMLYGLRQSEIKPSDKASDGPAVRVQLQNPNVNVTQWLIRESGRPQAEISLGPAKVVLVRDGFKYEGGNVLVLKPGEPKWTYEVYTARQGGKSAQGKITEGEKVATGWMGLELTLLRILPRATEEITYIRKERSGQFTRQAIQIRFQGQAHWLGLNSVLRLYSDDSMYYVTYANRRLDLGFPMTLKKFNMGHYQGTLRASSYESEVEVEGLGSHLISMNEPLHYNGYTFYQASFEQDEKGQPVASILSVNHDPGRVLKYLGSFLIVLGSIMLFYFKRMPFAKKRVEAK